MSDQWALNPAKAIVADPVGIPRPLDEAISGLATLLARMVNEYNANTLWGEPTASHSRDGNEFVWRKPGQPPQTFTLRRIDSRSCSLTWATELATNIADLGELGLNQVVGLLRFPAGMIAASIQQELDKGIGGVG